MTAAFATTPFESAVANASSYAKTRASAVSAGSVLWAFTWQYSATNTCASVADDLGGTWVKAFGPTRAGTNNGASNASIYGWYCLNSAVGGSPTNGTVTATWSGSATGGIVIGEITGLAGGGALDAQVSGVVDGIVSDISFGVTPTLAQAVEAAVMLVVAPGSAGLSTPHSPFVADVAIDSFNFERAYRAITTTNAALDAGLTASANVTDVGGLMVFKDAASSTLTGGFDLADFVNSGAFATGALSQLSGGLTVDDFLLSGTLGLAPGRIDTEPFKNWAGTLLPGVTVPNVVFLKLDRTLPLALANQVTAGDGVMTITNAALVTGTYYIVVSYDATGANVGAELVLAT
jgi:hypothetical protein